jgi:predicted DCC family thiol-disulfide oxidoreductase YuxK
MGLPNNHIVLYDGFCNLCSGSVQFIVKRDRKKVFSFISLQSEEAKEIRNLPVYDVRNPDTIILCLRGKIYQHSDAALRIAGQLKIPWNLFYVFIIVPPFIRDGIYRVISRNRYKWFGKRDNCYLLK